MEDTQAQAQEKKSIAERLHDAYVTIHEVDNEIDRAFEDHEPDVCDALDFRIGSDEYDNSIEIYVKNHLPYPYEPSWEVRDRIYAMGFSIVYWNFADEDGKFTEEIRGEEARRFKTYRMEQKPENGGIIWTMGHVFVQGVGYVDHRFDEKQWSEKYKRKTKPGQQS